MRLSHEEGLFKIDHAMLGSEFDVYVDYNGSFRIWNGIGDEIAPDREWEVESFGAALEGIPARAEDVATWIDTPCPPLRPRQKWLAEPVQEIAIPYGPFLVFRRPLKSGRPLRRSLRRAGLNASTGIGSGRSAAPGTNTPRFSSALAISRNAAPIRSRRLKCSSNGPLSAARRRRTHEPSLARVIRCTCG
jgi:hypothetical protein